MGGFVLLLPAVSDIVVIGLCWVPSETTMALHISNLKINSFFFTLTLIKVEVEIEVEDGHKFEVKVVPFSHQR